MKCISCNCNKPIVNKHFKLCLECNNIRLHGSSFGKQYKNTLMGKNPIKTSNNYINKKKSKKSKARKSLFIKNVDKSVNNNLEKDEQFYEKCFSNSDHKCEECGSELPDHFRDEDGKIVARFRYSHIIAKSIAPELRHNIDNINHLCLKDHTRWDHGDKENMKIFIKNRKKFPNYL